VLPAMIRRVCVKLGVAVLMVGAMAASAHAAASIRVMLASDVPRLEARADNVIWAADDRNQTRPYWAMLRIQVRGQAIFLNGSKIQGEQVTLRAGEQDLKLWLPQPNGNSNGAPAPFADDKPTLQVSGLVQLVLRGKGLLIVNHVDLEEYVKGVVPSEV